MYQQYRDTTGNLTSHVSNHTVCISLGRMDRCIHEPILPFILVHLAIWKWAFPIDSVFIYTPVCDL